MKTSFTLIIGLLIGIGIVVFWPVIIGALYVVMALVVGVITCVWTFLAPLMVVLIVGGIIYSICKFFYTLGQKKGNN